MLSGIPRDTVLQMRTEGGSLGSTGHVLTLEQPVVFALLAHADDRALRQEVFEVYNTAHRNWVPIHHSITDRSFYRYSQLSTKRQSCLDLNYAEYSLDTKWPNERGALVP